MAKRKSTAGSKSTKKQSNKAKSTSKTKSQAKKTETTQDFLPGIPGVVLSQEAKILRAPLIKNESAKGAQLYRIASITDIPEYGYLPSPSKQIKVKSSLDKAKKYSIEPFDVLLTIVGTIGKITIVPEELDGKWIPTSNMLIIRFHESKQDKAIAFYTLMKSEYGRKRLENLTHGATIPIVSKKSFSKTIIPQLSGDIKRESKKIFNNEEKIFNKIEDLYKSAEELRTSYLKQEG